MKRESMEKEQEQTELTPRQRLDCVNYLMALTDFSKKYERLDAEERDEFDLIQEAAFAAKDPKVEQHYFDQTKNFFVEKMDYDVDLFKDENLAQFTQQFNNLLKEDKERDEIAQKFIPDVEKRIHELNVEGIRLRAIKTQTEEIKNRIQTIMSELKKLRDRREQVVEPVYITRHKKMVN